ncbi:MAG: FAD-dependent oxidoreductase [Rhizobiales bacterium]|nr:FAD-dependent oxidoreductase [Hyphomicrobiales bacterium]
MAGTVHIVGAGLAGLAAAVELAEQGRRVVVHEAAKFAGGRCRSYYDAQIGMTIDNGNHLLLSGNRSAFDFLRRVGGLDALTGTSEAEFPFADLATGERWTLRPNSGRLPWWILDSRRRVPGSRAPDYLAPISVLRASAPATVGDVMPCHGPLYDRLWRPVLLAALNTEPCDADARLAAQILRETFGAGGQACRPFIAAGGLSAAFVEPALRHLDARGADIRFGRPLRGIQLGQTRAEALEFGEARIELEPEDAVILAVPAQVAWALVPGLSVPDRFHAIVNAHFRIAPPPGQPLFLGVINGVTEWLFAYPDRLSVTISCADRLVDEPRAELAAAIWREVASLTGLAPELPRWQIVRERRATFAATPAQEARRPETRTSTANLFLAGDWTRTGLPSTIEGSIRSGLNAATALSRSADAPRQSRAAA